MSSPHLDPAQRRASVEARYPEWTPQAIHAWFLRTAEAFPDRDFVVTDERTFSYREIAERVRRVAGGLHARGVRKGDHVAVMMANYPEYVVLKYALSTLGAVIVPLNFAFKRDELAFVLRNSEAVALITMTGFRGLDYLAMLDEIVPGWERGGFAELPDLRFVVQFEAMAPLRPGVAAFPALEAGGEPPDDLPEVAGDDLSILFYTSGSTGAPKGVLWTHDQDARIGYGGAVSRAFGDGWRVLSALPLYHAFANNEVLNASMFAGGAVITRLQFAPDDILAAIERHRANELVTVPTMVISLCDGATTTDHDMGSLVGLMSAGAPAPVWLWERAMSLLQVTEATTGYGQTESGGGQVMSRPEDGVEFVASTVGRIKYAGVAGIPERGGDVAEMRAADPETGEILPDGEIGELISRGPVNAVGYWKRPDETTTFREGGWVYSGDIGRVTSDGAVHLTGRKKELIRSGAENYAPKEVEDLLTSQPGISQAYVVGIPDPKWGEIGCAWLVRDSGTDADEAALAHALERVCREKLAAFKRPRQFRFIEAAQLPTTATGKVQKFRLVEMAAQGPVG
ncbi:class I adenylate-forming enzyme family protein [Microbacterium sp. No. 7]|uniref:class I adenylate-forming enzyme family protein n=1 Tax=Microbacterium sp. No. 7 TaxID=1714373 RepID=UPI0006CF6D11|nr:AMP-binding protein [Microbacterium sp. No. 7]ALJ21666.1 hypothetical protein AOA12_17920 [Microbacterium sp. No. 7]